MYNHTDHMVGEFYFYNLSKTVEVYSHQSSEEKYNIETGILLSFDRYQDDSMIVFHTSYIEYDPLVYQLTISLNNFDQERGIITLDYEHLVPIFLIFSLCLILIKRKYKKWVVEYATLLYKSFINL